MWVKMLPGVLMGWLKPVKIFLANSKGPMCNTSNSMLQANNNSITTWNICKGSPNNLNQHSVQDPWYGAGQCAGDACLHWIVQANSITLAYESQATPWTISSTNGQQYHHQVMDAFIDDMCLTMGQPQMQLFLQLVHHVQSHLTLWHDLLQASGGVLNPSKCVWLCFNWHINPQGQAIVVSLPLTASSLTITVHGQLMEAIKLLQLHESHCYLGIYLTMDGNIKWNYKPSRNVMTPMSIFSRLAPFPNARSRSSTNSVIYWQWPTHCLPHSCQLPHYTSYRAQQHWSSSPKWDIPNHSCMPLHMLLSKVMA